MPTTNPGHTFHVGPAGTHADLLQILALQKQNLRTLISEETKQAQGFVTVQHDFAQLKLLFDTAPQIVAKMGGEVVAYALAMPPSLASVVPLLRPMFELFDRLDFEGRPLSEQRFFVNGQICVAEKCRGLGVFDLLYQGYKAAFCGNFDICATEISTSNGRSMRAHERVGFQTIHQYRDETDEWNIVAWRMECP